MVAVQLSKDPPSTLAGTSVAAPAAFRLRVKSLQITFGICISRTVTVNTQSVELPAASVARNVTVLVAPAAVGPLGNRLPLGRLGGTNATVAPQLSLSTGLVNTSTAPHLSTSLFSTTSAGQFRKVGFWLSTTWMVISQVATLPN